MLGILKPTSGSILYDGIDLAELDIKNFRQQTASVLATSVIFSDSIYSNIVVGKEIPKKECMKYVEMAGFLEDIKKLPMGLETVLINNGAQLSGGQKQKLLITRALASTPKIIFLDEATSWMDEKSQNIIEESIRDLKITRIVIAHRLSTISNADKFLNIE
jgi:ATP-binding cassette subfamily C protein